MVGVDEEARMSRMCGEGAKPRGQQSVVVVCLWQHAGRIPSGISEATNSSMLACLGCVSRERMRDSGPGMPHASQVRSWNTSMRLDCGTRETEQRAD